MAQVEVKYLDTEFKDISSRLARYKMEISTLNDTVYKHIYTIFKNRLVMIYKHPIQNPEWVHNTTFRSNNTVQHQGWFLHKLKSGEWHYYLMDGVFIKSKTFVNDEEVFFKLYHRNGQVKKAVKIEKGSYHGPCKFYNEIGELYAEGNYNFGKLIGEFKHYAINDSLYKMRIIKFRTDTTVRSQVMPEYPGGEMEMMKFIETNIEYPEMAKNKGIGGVLRVKFTVKSDGSIADVNILNKELIGYGCEREAIEIVESMPNWTPGIQDGKPVPVYYNLPVRFKIF